MCACVCVFTFFKHSSIKFQQSDSEDYKKNAKAVLKKCVGEEGAGEGKLLAVSQTYIVVGKLSHSLCRIKH